jgi:uncharacterized protein
MTSPFSWTPVVRSSFGKLGLVRGDRRAIGLRLVPGEDLLFRGLLLLRMQGVFGRGDFVANGVLFAFYHLHQPWSIPAALADIILTSYPTRRWQSVWMSVIVHSAQSDFVFIIILALVLG